MAARAVGPLLLFVLLLSACSSSESAEPTRVSDVDRLGPFSLAITVPRTQYAAEEPIEAFATFAYSRPKAGEDLSGSGSGPIIFLIEQSDGPIDAGGFVTSDCARLFLERDGPLVQAFQKGAAFSADDLMADFWRRGPPIRFCACLPATMSSPRSSTSSSAVGARGRSALTSVHPSRSLSARGPGVYLEIEIDPGRAHPSGADSTTPREERG